MESRLWGWVILFAAMIISAFIVPFVFLSNVTSFYGAFLFWTVFAVAAIAGVMVITGGWRD